MTTYIIKRILLMIPTFLAISVIIFVVLNLAPGDPAAAQAASDGAESVSADARESYRIFKEQFNLDKPIVLNTRFALTKSDVLEPVQAVSDFRLPVCAEGQAPSAECTPMEERPSSGEIIGSQEILEDWGSYAVPHLYAIAMDESIRLDIRRMAANQLGSNAQRRVLSRHQLKTLEDRDRNRAVAADNNRLRRWSVPRDATAEDLDKHMAETWTPWFEENQARFDYSTADKIGIFFTDTRFYRYWANLNPITVEFKPSFAVAWKGVDFGISTVDRRPVMETILSKLPYTITLSFFSIFFAYLISIPLGIWSAYNQNTKRDQAVTVMLFVLYS
ncbi:MAG: hypothetical protein ACNA8W_23770, partial [Bradymonadaceae bacterium]